VDLLAVLVLMVGLDILVKFHQLITALLTQINVEDTENVFHQLLVQLMSNVSVLMDGLDLIVTQPLLFVKLKLVKMKVSVCLLMMPLLLLVSVLIHGLEINANGMQLSLLEHPPPQSASLEISSLVLWLFCFKSE
jgi:hypothetical protein